MLDTANIKKSVDIFTNTKTAVQTDVKRKTA